MGLLLGGAIAAAFGGADFLGGLAARRTPLSAVVLGGLVTGTAVALVFVAAVPEPFPAGDDVWRAAAIGIVAPSAVACLYGGLAVGRMSVVAPISAVGGAVLPVLWGLGSGERPSVLAVAGIVVALIAVALVARGPGADPIRPGTPRLVEIGLATAAGLLFGVILVLFSETGDDAGMWPILVIRLVAVPATAAVLLALRLPLRPGRSEAGLVAGAGAFDALANVAQLVAVRHALVSLVAPVASLYPAVTVVLARVLLAERVRRLQIVGLGLALVGLALIALG